MSYLAIPAKFDDMRPFVDRIAALAKEEPDTLLAPARIAWLPREHKGERSARVSDRIMLRDPRKPSEKEQKRVVQIEPDRYRVVAAQPADGSVPP